ncbi:MAG: hypothetical protein ABSD48_13305 [Armatimonadota bacterium]|jgi:hypothetical protein
MRSGTHSIQIVYQSPTDPGVWYAPETLLWCLVLVDRETRIIVERRYAA